MLFLLVATIIPLGYYMMNSIMSDIGIVKYRKGKIAVRTTMGKLTLPHVVLPSYDWDVQFFTESSGFTEDNGIHDSSVVENFVGIKPKIIRNMIICETLYPEELGKDVKYVINSPFDNICYVQKLEPGKMIDYRLYNNTFADQIEQM